MAGVGQAEGMIQSRWRQQADKVSRKHDQNPDVPEVAADHQLTLA
jgi:hypothetical protein